MPYDTIADRVPLPSASSTACGSVIRSQPPPVDAWFTLVPANATVADPSCATVPEPPAQVDVPGVPALNVAGAT